MIEGNGSQERLANGGLPDSVALMALAHELKSPLALIRQLSLYGEQAEDPEYVATLMRQITLTSERALRLATDLSRAARLDDSLFALEPLNPDSVCSEVLRQAEPLYRARDRRIEYSGQSRSRLALANRDLLSRILLNFADNALNHASSDKPVVISTTPIRRGSALRLGVRDYGPAIPINVWSALVSRMSQGARQPLHSRPGSSGLGLMLSQQFAGAMQATVGATRHRDGATFYVEVATSTQLRLL